jgi:nucleoside-diphosphate-sugar epimerase
MYDEVVREDLERITTKSLPWQQLKGKTFAISGANGLLPSYMVETLLYLNSKWESTDQIRVLAMVRDVGRARERFKHHGDRKDLQIIKVDLGSPITFNLKVDFIVHGASPASPQKYVHTPEDLYITNVLGTYNLLKAASAHKAEQFLYISSGEVYGRVDRSQLPVKETTFGAIDPTRLRSCYAESKRIAENMCATFYAQHKISAKIVRPCHTFGPWLSLNDGRVFGDFISNIIEGRSIKLKSDGTALRTFCYLADATEAFFRVMLTGAPGEAYNVASKECTISILELAEMLTDSFGTAELLRATAEELEKNKLPAGEIWPDSTPDPSKLMELGWRPETSLKEAFARTLKSLGHKKI